MDAIFADKIFEDAILVNVVCVNALHLNQTRQGEGVAAISLFTGRVDALFVVAIFEDS